MKSCNLLDANWGPLSDTSWCGSPAWANTWRSTAMVLEVEVEPIVKTSGHLEWASTRMKSILPWNGPARSTCTLCQGLAGQIHRCIGATAGKSLLLWQGVLPLTAAKIHILIASITIHGAPSYSKPPPDCAYVQHCLHQSPGCHPSSRSHAVCLKEWCPWSSGTMLLLMWCQRVDVYTDTDLCGYWWLCTSWNLRPTGAAGRPLKDPIWKNAALLPEK